MSAGRWMLMRGGCEWLSPHNRVTSDRPHVRTASMNPDGQQSPSLSPSPSPSPTTAQVPSIFLLGKTEHKTFLFPAPVELASLPRRRNAASDMYPRQAAGQRSSAEYCPNSIEVVHQKTDGCTVQACSHSEGRQIRTQRWMVHSKLQPEGRLVPRKTGAGSTPKMYLQPS